MTFFPFNPRIVSSRILLREGHRAIPMELSGVGGTSFATLRTTGVGFPLHRPECSEGPCASPKELRRKRRMVQRHACYSGEYGSNFGLRFSRCEARPSFTS